MPIVKYKDLEKSNASPEGMKVVYPHADRQAFREQMKKFEDAAEEDIVIYSELSGEQQKMSIFCPKERTGKLPLIVYIPGSGWEKQAEDANRDVVLYFVSMGFAVARPLHRPSDIAPFPAQVIDSKNAVKCVMKYADKYCIDTDRIGLFGDSSGGHTALFDILTMDDSYVDKTLYTDIKLKVKALCEWFGPSDLYHMNDAPCCYEFVSPGSLVGKLLGGVVVTEHETLADEASPINHVAEAKSLPPVMIFHGNRDSIVAFDQSVRMYEKLKAAKADVTFYCVDGADHFDEAFVSDEVLGETVRFFKEIL